MPMTMQVQIRHVDGGDVSLEDCARFSDPMGQAIEASNLLNEAYVLEVSSPGLSETLTSDRDFKTFKGFPIEVIYKTTDDTEHSKTGLLHTKSKDHVQINNKGKMTLIPLADVTLVRLTTPTG